MFHNLELIKSTNRIEISGIYTFYYYEHANNYYCSGERHNFWELIYVDTGDILARTDTESHLVPHGSVIFHKPMEFHAMEAINNKPHNILVITFETNSKDMSFFENKVISLNLKHKKILSRLIKEFAKIFGPNLQTRSHHDEIFEEGGYGAMQLGIGYLEQFLVELIRDSYCQDNKSSQRSIEKKNTNETFIDDILQFLEQNINTNITLTDICEHFHFSKSYICEIFKLHTDKSVIDYYIDLKIAAAKMMIREGGMNFTQIAETLGYTSVHSFSRTFKQREKISPREYVNSIKES